MSDREELACAVEMSSLLQDCKKDTAPDLPINMKIKEGSAEECECKSTTFVNLTTGKPPTTYVCDKQGFACKPLKSKHVVIVVIVKRKFARRAFAIQAVLAVLISVACPLQSVYLLIGR